VKEPHCTALAVYLLYVRGIFHQDHKTFFLSHFDKKIVQSKSTNASKYKEREIQKIAHIIFPQKKKGF
jgi:hypothetical protein